MFPGQGIDIYQFLLFLFSRERRNMFIEIEIDGKVYEKAEKQYFEIRSDYELKYPELRQLMDKIVKTASSRTKNERNKKIFEMRENGSRFTEIANTFDLSVERVRAIYKKELAKKQYLERIAKSKPEERSSLFACFEEACITLNRDLSLATRTYNALRRARIAQEIEQGKESLSKYSDEELLNLRNFGIVSLEISRLADELYFKKF